MTQIEILITATINMGDNDEAKKLLRSNLEEALIKCVREFTDDNATEKGQLYYIVDIEHEVAYGEEGRFEFKPSLISICDKCKDRLVLNCKGHSQDIYKGVIVACTGFHQGTVGFIKSD